MQIDGAEVPGTRWAENKGISTRNAFEKITKKIGSAFMSYPITIGNNVNVKTYL